MVPYKSYEIMPTAGLALLLRRGLRVQGPRVEDPEALFETRELLQVPAFSTSSAPNIYSIDSCVSNWYPLLYSRRLEMESPILPEVN